MKPTGIGIEIEKGALTLCVQRSNKTEDAIWAAVEEAIDNGWDAKRFKREVADAWEHHLKESIKSARAELSR